MTLKWSPCKLQLSVLGLEKGDEKKKRKTADNTTNIKKLQKPGCHPTRRVEGVSGKVDRVLKKYGVTTAMRPHTTLRRLLVPPKGKVVLEENGELVYTYCVIFVAHPTEERQGNCLTPD